MNRVQKEMYMEMEMNMEYTCPLNHLYPFKGQQAYTIINVCVFMNKIHKQMGMEMNME